MKHKKFQIYLLSCILGGGVVLSLVNANNGHGISTNESLHESILAQLNGTSTSGDITGDTGGGTDTAPTGPDSEYYNKDEKLKVELKQERVITNNKGELRVGPATYHVDPFTLYTVTTKDSDCVPESGKYCDIRKQMTTWTYEKGMGTALPDVPEPSQP